MQPLRIGLIGAARIAPLAIIQPAALRDDVEIVAVAARDVGRAKAFAAQHGIPHIAPSYADLVRREDVDLVYVATATGLHLGPTVDAMRVGKAVLCEKPLAAELSDVETMVAESRRTSQLLMEAFHYRFHPAFLHVLDAVRSGRIGQITSIEAHFDATIPFSPTEPRWIHELGGGALLDLGCYSVHAVRSIMGAEPAVVESRQGISNGVDAWSSATLEFPSGVRATFRCTMLATQSDRTLKIFGDKGVLEISDYVHPYTGSWVTIDGGDRVEFGPSGPTTFKAQLDHVVEVMRGQAQPITGGDDALGNARVLQAIRDRAVTEAI